MAKKNLEELLAKIINDTEAKDEYRSRVNLYKHMFSFSKSQIYREVERQIRGDNVTKSIDALGIVIYKTDEIKLREAVDNYFESLVLAFSGYSTVNVSTRVKVLMDRAVVSIVAKKGSINIFRVINSIRKPPLDALKKDILNILRKPSTTPRESSTLDQRVLGGINPRTNERSGGLLQLGHLTGHSIAERRVPDYLLELGSISSMGSDNESGSANNPVIDLVASLYKSNELNELKNLKISTTVRVREQGQKSNADQAQLERSLVKVVREAIQETIDKEDFINFSSSPSAMEIARRKILETAEKSGAKIKGQRSKSNVTPYTIKKQIKLPKPKIIPVNIKGEKSKLSVTNKTSNQSRNWLQLLPIINAKLTDRVMQNMKNPRLVNRTGRFAQSARVVNVEQTSQGFPSFVFDYERDPYDVFDRTLGRSPWNTAQRDPRALVDLSVREIVKEMAIGRFYTRRA